MNREVKIRKYLGIFPLFGGFIVLYSIQFPAAIYNTGWGYLELMAWGWMHSRGIWAYMIIKGFIHSPLVMWLSIIWIIGLVTCGIIMIVSGFYYISKLHTGALLFKKYKILGISCGIIVVLLPIIWMIGVEYNFFIKSPNVYEEAGLSFLRDLKLSVPIICSFAIGPLNIIISILTPSKRP